MRAALGAGRGRLMRQLLTESVVLGIAGGVHRSGDRRCGQRAALIAAQPADIPAPRRRSASTARWSLVHAGIALLTSLAFGILPALQSTARPLCAALREGGARQRRRRRPSPACGAGRRRDGARGRAADRRRPADSELRRADAGAIPASQPNSAMAFRVTMQGEAYKEAQQIADARGRVRGAAARAAGRHRGWRRRACCRSAAAARCWTSPWTARRRRHRTSTRRSPWPARRRTISAPSARRCDAAGCSPIAITTDAPRVALINEAAAPSLVRATRIRWAARRHQRHTREIVGVVGDVLQRNPGQPAGAAAIRAVRAAHHPVRPDRRARGRRCRCALAPAIRSEVRALDPESARSPSSRR